VAAGANPLIVITDPFRRSDCSVCCLQDTFVALADTVTLIGSPITVVVAVHLHQHFH
jgi:hypothetical protein